MKGSSRKVKVYRSPDDTYPILGNRSLPMIGINIPPIGVPAYATPNAKPLCCLNHCGMITGAAPLLRPIEIYDG